MRRYQKELIKHMICSISANEHQNLQFANACKDFYSYKLSSSLLDSWLQLIWTPTTQVHDFSQRLLRLFSLLFVEYI
ncbi:hypothetical protein OIU78_023132 [Salix suchowensis]|nr:hypothetical protein OIU78_023132 [Salix suchowensis]